MPPHILLYGLPRQFPNYERALVCAGAVVRYGSEETCDALLLPGGGDLHPRFYGAPLLDCRGMDETRDVQELALCRQFLAAGKPILGICRGFQVLNVALGGTLQQHVEEHGTVKGQDRIHPTRAAKNSFAEILYGQSFSVNSAHHQAADRLGEDLEAVQWTSDGIIEAAAHRTLPVWGVQWHPERLEQRQNKSDTVSGQRLIDLFVSTLPY